MLNAPVAPDVTLSAPLSPVATTLLARLLDRLPRVTEAGREAINEPSRPIGCAEQQRLGVRGDLPPSKAATTGRPSTATNPNKSGIHSVCIGALHESS
jgi:hypothetical protein